MLDREELTEMYNPAIAYDAGYFDGLRDRVKGKKKALKEHYIPDEFMILKEIAYEYEAGYYEGLEETGDLNANS